MRMRNWWLVAMALLSMVVACSGNSARDKDEPHAGADAGSGRPSAGSSGMGARGGRGGNVGSGGAAAGTGGVSSGGFGNVGADAGEAGVPGVGGTEIAGSGGVAGISGSAGTAGTGGVAPVGWQCGAVIYGDGSCDCGCGVQDIDCKRSDDLDECVTCNDFGSCNKHDCPGRIDPEDTSSCITPPAEWSCLLYYYSDNASCDCGCGAPDPDCENEDIGSCNTCGLSGSCGGGSCPASIDPDDITTCAVPDGWTCGTTAYSDGFYCDCGCGAVDSDCGGSSRDYCSRCTSTGSCAETEGYCSDYIDADNNAICSGPPGNWTCNDRFYADGVLCHCGCGVIDPDCADSECEVCNAQGACSSRPCPGSIDPNNEQWCVQPEPPEGWTCDRHTYGDGVTCHCGCGVQDFDCLTADVSACEDCYKCSNRECPSNVDATDPTRCMPPPAGWRCGPETYLDGNCDCGCGTPDPDCEQANIDYCSRCPDGSCTDESCVNLDPNDPAHCLNEPPPAWTCTWSFYGDTACDCGCGVIDVDCASPARSSCDFCNPEGGCSNMNCAAGLINSENNAVCGG
jgi:hypothetical protein